MHMGKPRLPVTEDGPKPGLREQMRSQAGAWGGNFILALPNILKDLEARYENQDCYYRRNH